MAIIIFSFILILTVLILQVMNKSGVYVPAIPVPDTVLVNVADMVQRWTCDKLVSTVKFTINIIVSGFKGKLIWVHVKVKPKTCLTPAQIMLSIYNYIIVKHKFGVR